MRLPPIALLSLTVWCLPALSSAAPSKARTRLEIVLSVAGARVEVNGAVVADAAAQSLTVDVKEGSHVVKASKEGFETLQKEVTVGRGETARVDLLLPVAKPPEPPVVAQNAPRSAPVRIAVYELTRQEGVPERTSAIVSEALLAEVRKLDRSSAVGMSEIAEMLSFEEQRQLLGCGDDSCLAEIGGALGVDQLVSGSVGVLGGTTMLSLRRINLAEAKVMGSVTRRFPSGTGEELLAAIGPAIEELFPEMPLRPGRTRGASIDAVQMLDPPPLPTWAFWTTAGASVAALAVAGAFGWSATTAEAEYNAAAKRALSEPVSGAELRSIGQRATSSAQSANIALIAAGGLALAAGIEALFTDWHGYGDKAVDGGVVTLSPTTNGMVATLRF